MQNMIRKQLMVSCCVSERLFFLKSRDSDLYIVFFEFSWHVFENMIFGQCNIFIQLKPFDDLFCCISIDIQLEDFILALLASHVHQSIPPKIESFYWLLLEIASFLSMLLSGFD